MAAAKGDEEKAKKMLLWVDSTVYYIVYDFNRPNEDVERIRRAHQNDLENVPVFLVLGLLYTLLSPEPTLAKYHFIGFTAARVCHSIAYMFLKSYSIRGIAFLGGMATNMSMAIRVLLKVW